MEELSIPCAITEGDRLAFREDSRGGKPLVRVDADQYANLGPTGVAEAAGWLLGWLAEHAPEERTKLVEAIGAAADSAMAEDLAHEARADRDALAAELVEARESLRIRTADRDAAEKDLAAIADAVGLGGTRTRYEGQLLGKVENLIADVSDLRAANRTLTDANRELRAVLAEVPAQREAAAVATFEAVRAAFAGCEVVIRVPEVTRG